jgi:hypothetical protein
MNVMMFAAVLLSLFTSVACAPDEHGDLRTQIAVEQVDGHPRVRYRGVGVGMDVAEAFAVLGEQPDPIYGGNWLLRERDADFGTRLDLVFRSEPDVPGITRLELIYVGNLVAIGKVRERWQQALGLAGRDCDDACYWDDGDAQVASIRRKRGSIGKDELTVGLYR